MASWAKKAVKPPWWEVGPWVAAIVTLSSPRTAGCPRVTSCAARGALVPRVAPCNAVKFRFKGNIIISAPQIKKSLSPQKKSFRTGRALNAARQARRGVVLAAWAVITIRTPHQFRIGPRDTVIAR